MPLTVGTYFFLPNSKVIQVVFALWLKVFTSEWFDTFVILSEQRFSDSLLFDTDKTD